MSTATIIKMLEDTLRKAKEEEFTSLAMLVTAPQGDFYNWSSGREPDQLELVASLYDVLRAHVENWRPFAGDESLGAQYACYHCALVPPGFDFLTWLITQEVYRIDAEAPAPLKVAFWQGRKPHNNPWIDAVYRPLIKMIGAVEDDTAMGRMGADIHVTRTMAALYRVGAKLPQLHAVGDYDLPRNCITITLREALTFPHRNSDLIVWYEFAKLLQRRGERVIFVRDTAKADEPLGPMETFPQASRELDARMWLYEHSKLNFFVSNGPMMLAVMSEHIPYIGFVQPEEMDSKYDSNKPTFWKLSMGVQIGDQFPWAGSHQRIIWEKAGSVEILERAYDEWLMAQQSIAAE